MFLTICVLLGILLGVAPVTPAASVSVFLNPPQDGRGCGISDFGFGQQVADDFQLAGPFLTITQVQWWGGYGFNPDPSPGDNFKIRFFYDIDGSPVVDPFTTMSASSLSRTVTSLTASSWGSHDGGTVYKYLVDLPAPITLSAGTTYYLSVINNTSSTWGWLEDGSPSHWYRLSDSNSWQYSGRDTNLSFELLAVPEPATLLLLSMGGIALLRKRRA
jgi:hypothetical protein